jgi:DNA-binding NtrC family response regulator
MQVTLLRALQGGVIRQVGGNEDVRVDTRVVAATNRSLAEMVEAGRFRKDLFYRLNVVTITLPALRERREDVPLLVDHFLELIAARMKSAKKGVTRAAMRRLVDHGWPGNVRELEHTLTNAAVLADGEVLDVADFEAILTPARPARTTTVADERREREKARIVAALDRCGWNKSKACAELGIPRRTLYRRLSELGIA